MRRLLLRMAPRTIGPAAAILLLVVPAAAGAQVRPQTWVGLDVSFMRLDRLDTTPAALGGRITIDLSDAIAIDGEVNFYPKDTIALDNSVPFVPEYRVEYRRSRVEALAGIKAGPRFGRLGLFGKARAGFMRLHDGGTSCSGAGCAVILLVNPVYRTELAFDLGGGVDVFAAPTALVRIDIGDTIIRNRGTAPPCARCTTHNVTTRIGIAIGF